MPLGVAVTTWPIHRKTSLWNQTAVHRPHNGGDHGGDQVSLPYSLEKNGGDQAVNTGHSGDTLTSVVS
jgi:hypothetical protein